MKIVYFYAKEGKKIGPLSRTQLDDLHLEPNTLVWHYGLTGWIQYKELNKEEIKENEDSLFNRFCAWLKEKKKTTIKAEFHAKPVVEKPTEEVAETTESPIEEEQEVVSPQPVAHNSEDKSEKRKKTRRILKRILIGFLILTGVAGIAFGSFCLYGYYEYEYLPEKRLNEACTDLETKWEEADNIEKQTMAIKILSKDAKWGYDDVPDSEIDCKFSAPKRKIAFNFIEDNAFRGNAFSQFWLGQLYYHDERYYVTADYNKAAYWWKESANNGNMAAMNNLGVAYHDGIGVQRNLEKALECYRIAAAANDEYGLYNMGCMYETGIRIEAGSHYEQYRSYNNNGPKYYGDEFVRSGWNDMDYYEVYKHKVIDYKVLLPKDMHKAREYWEKAAALGHSEAKEKLQRIF